MDFFELLDILEKDEKLKNLGQHNFLCSIFAQTNTDKIDKWIVHFCAKDGDLIDVCVSEDNITIGEPSKPLGKMKRLDIKKVKISGEEALKLAHEKYRKKVDTTMISLYTAKKITWTISYISTDFTIARFDIDAENGKLISQEFNSIMNFFKNDFIDKND